MVEYTTQTIREIKAEARRELLEELIAELRKQDSGSTMMAIYDDTGDVAYIEGDVCHEDMIAILQYRLVIENATTADES